MSLIKIIHQSWQTSDVPDVDYPNSWQKSWIDQNPDWEYKLWTDEDNARLVRDYYPRFWDAYEKISKGVVKSDFARLLYMHKFGGLYADLDYICLRPMTNLLEVAYPLLKGDRKVATLLADSTHFASWPRQSVNAWMYSAPGNWVLPRAIEDGVGYFNADPNVQNTDTEAVFGSKRLVWLEHAYGSRANIATVSRSMVCPKCAWHDSGGAEALTFWRDMPRVAAEFPDAYAVTAWRGGWWRSRWVREGTLEVIQGS